MRRKNVHLLTLDRESTTVHDQYTFRIKALYLGDS